MKTQVGYHRSEVWFWSNKNGSGRLWVRATRVVLVHVVHVCGCSKNRIAELWEYLRVCSVVN